MPKVSAIVLAGGKSRRLSMDKALLQLNGEWLLERILNTLATLSNAFDPEHLSFFNINTRHELELAQELSRQGTANWIKRNLAL